jgi:hypothetical protein
MEKRPSHGLSSPCETNALKAYVDDAVFGGEIVEIPLASDVDGPALIHGIETLETPATITADLIE